MKTNLFKKLLAVAALAFHALASAEDIDLFTSLPPNPNDLPNVLFVLDNTANWNNAFDNEMAALKAVVANLPVNSDGSARFRIGFMLFTETGGGNSGNDGGYVRVAIRDLTTDTQAKYIAFLNSLNKLNDKSNGGKAGLTMLEVYRYFSGLAPYAGNGKAKTDYTGNTSGTTADNAVYGIASVAPNRNALDSKNATRYNTPLVSGSCAKNFVIYISNGTPSDNNNDTTTATSELAAVNGNTTAIPLSPSGSQDNVADEWARFLKASSLNIKTYTLDVDKVTTGQGPGWSALLNSMATASSGTYFDVSSGNGGQNIKDALSGIFSEIQAVNSVFASVSLPIAVNTQGTYRNQVYIGMFRPDGTAAPRWAGNLKQYKLGYTNGALKLLDADSASAINSSTGFVTECARSFWTPTATDNYWAYRPLGACLTIANADISNYPDGNVVDKGAHAYKLRSISARTVKTCSTTFANCTSMIDLDSSTATASALGAASTTERDALISWATGLNPDNEGAKGTTAKRPSIHGDVMHSRPVALNYGTEAVPKIVVFYGSNDGVLRAVNGNRDNTGTDTSKNIVSGGNTYVPGQELWAFVPPEFFPYIKRLRDNSPELYYPGTPTITTGPKPYAIDGPISAYKDSSNAYIYATMRRGGRAMYAFNVTDPTNPSLKWKKGCPNAADDTGCTSNFDGIGQTWSAPITVFNSSYGSSPLIMMGGGYDPCEDPDVNTCANGTKGNKVYVMDANNGTLVKTFTTDRAVIADIAPVPDADGTTKHAYAVDLGGNVYRINMGALAPANWTMVKIASLGCDTTATCASNRKFMFPPSVLEDGQEYIILLGSGDREKPLNASYYPNTAAVANAFFMFRDKPLDSSWLTDEQTNGVCGQSVLCKSSLYPITSSANPTAAQLATKKGWYLALRSTEQVVTSAITVFNNVTFSTHIPAVSTPGVCSSLGTASVYNISYKNASSSKGGDRYETVSGGGLPPSPKAGNVTLDDGSTVPFCFGCSPDSPLQAGPPISPLGIVQPKARVYWYIQK